MFQNAREPIPCLRLLEDYKKTRGARSGSRLVFKGMDGCDVYNISVPFEDGGDTYIAGRVDRRASEVSRVVIFRKNGNVFEPAVPEVRFFSFQDPFVTRINGEIILGGVQVDTDPLEPNKIICWRTLFYRGKELHHLKLFASGPNRMKDIRIVGLKNGKIGVFTRPQGNRAGMGKIGYRTLNSLDELSEETILGAKIFDTFFMADEWGGPNDIHLLKNGNLGVVGHIARMTKGNVRHYYSAAFVFNPETLEHTPVKIIAQRADLPEGPAKREDLKDVLFTGGLVRNGWDSLLYTGVSDAEAMCAAVDDPFAEYDE